MIQIDTRNILFICGGAFAGLEKVVESRIGSNGIEFGADVRRAEEKELGEILGIAEVAVHQGDAQ